MFVNDNPATVTTFPNVGLASIYDVNAPIFVANVEVNVDQARSPHKLEVGICPSRGFLG